MSFKELEVILYSLVITIALVTLAFGTTEFFQGMGVPLRDSSVLVFFVIYSSAVIFFAGKSDGTL